MRRIVLDTNCLLMLLPSHSIYHSVWQGFINGTIEFCVSTEILLEYEEILAANVSPYMADIVIQALINRPNLIRVEPTWRWHLIEADQDDNKFVDCAIAGQAEYIVSNDSHFRVLRQIPFPYVPLMTLSEFTQDLNATHNVSVRFLSHRSNIPTLFHVFFSELKDFVQASSMKSLVSSSSH